MTKQKSPPRKGSRRSPNSGRGNARSAPPRGPRKGAANAPDQPPSPSSGSPWLYGLHAVLAALANPQRVHHRLIVARENATALQSRLTDAVQSAGKTGMSAEILDKKDLEALLPPAAVHQGVALLSQMPEQLHLEELIDGIGDNAPAVLVILDQASDPHNVGAVLRSAAAFGAVAVVVPDRHSPDVTGVLAKAASGALEQVPIVRVSNLVRAMEQLKERGFWCIGLDGEARTSLPQVDLAARTALVLGAEGAGLRRLTRDHCDVLVKVPIGKAVESLNLSNAAAVALYEYARRNL